MTGTPALTTGHARDRAAPRRALLAIALVLLPVAAVGIARALVNPVAFANRHIDAFALFASTVLQQKLTIGGVSGRIYPELSLDVHDIALAALVPGEAPMLLVPAVSIRFRLRDALLSFGRVLPLESISVTGAMLTLHRGEDGGLDIATTLKRLPPLDPHDLVGGVLSVLTVTDAQIHLVDDRFGADHEVVITDLAITTNGALALGAPVDISATFTWSDSDTAEGPLAGLAEVRFDALPPDLVLWPPPVGVVHLALPRTDLPRAMLWLNLPSLFTSGTVDIAIDAATGPDFISGTIDVDGVGVSAVVTTGAGAGAEDVGEAGVARLRSDVRLAVDGLRTELDNFAFDGAGIGIEGSAVFLEPSLVGIAEMDVTAHADELARLGLLIPALRNVSTGALQIAGTGTGSLTADPTSFALDLELDGARVRLGEAVAKHRGERLHLSLGGARDSLANGSDEAESAGAIDSVLRADLPHGVVIEGDLLFQPANGPRALFNLATRRVGLAAAAAVSPVLRDMVAGVVRAGTLRAAMRGEMGTAGNTFAFNLDTRGLDLGNDATRATGAARVRVNAFADARGLRIGVDANLDLLRIETLDAQARALALKPEGDMLRVGALLHEVGGPGSLGRALYALDPTAREGGSVFLGSGLSPRWRRLALGMRGHGTIKAERLELLGVSFTAADIAVSLRAGRITVDSAGVQMFSGRASVAHSMIDLHPPLPTWLLALNVQDIDLAHALAPLHSFTGDVEGTAELQAHLAGAGLSLEKLRSSLDGPVVIRTHGVRIAAIDTLSRMLADFWSGIAWLTGSKSRDAEVHTLSDALRDGEWSTRFVGNQFRLDNPVVLLTTLGLLTLTGHAALDGALDLRAHLELGEQIADVALAVDASVTGTWEHPVFTSVNLDALTAVARRAIEDAVAKQLSELQRALGLER